MSHFSTKEGRNYLLIAFIVAIISFITLFVGIQYHKYSVHKQENLTGMKVGFMSGPTKVCFEVRICVDTVRVNKTNYEISWNIFQENETKLIRVQEITPYPSSKKVYEALMRSLYIKLEDI